MLTKKRTCQIVDFAILADHIVKLKECKKREKYLDLARELKKNREHDRDTHHNWYIQYSHKRIGTGTGGLGNKTMSGDHPNYSIIKIGQNTEKSLRDRRRLEIWSIMQY